MKAAILFGLAWFSMLVAVVFLMLAYGLRTPLLMLSALGPLWLAYGLYRAAQRASIGIR